MHTGYLDRLVRVCPVGAARTSSLPENGNALYMYRNSDITKTASL